MRCDICSKREAVIRVERSWARQTQELSLCEVCAEELGVDSESSMPTPSVEELISGVMSGDAEGDEAAYCDGCGKPYREIRKTGRLGCAQCYAVFENEIRSVLERRPSPAQHAGKYPERLQLYKRFFVDRERLRRRLEAAVAEENYEQAAELRDELARIDREVEHG